MNDKKETVFMFIFVASFLVTLFFLCTGRSTVHHLRERADSSRAEPVSYTHLTLPTNREV